MANVFAVHDPYVGVDESTRRSLGQMDLDSPQLLRVIEACKKLGLKPESPIFTNSCAAHLGIRSKKLAFYIREKVELARYAAEQAKWSAHGWTTARVSHLQLRTLTDEQIVEHLREAIKSLGKKR